MKFERNFEKESLNECAIYTFDYVFEFQFFCHILTYNFQKLNFNLLPVPNNTKLCLKEKEGTKILKVWHILKIIILSLPPLLAKRHNYFRHQVKIYYRNGMFLKNINKGFYKKNIYILGKCFQWIKTIKMKSNHDQFISQIKIYSDNNLSTNTFYNL